MNIKTSLLEEYVNFVDNTNRQKKFFKTFFLSNCYNYVFNLIFSPNSVFKMNNIFSLQQLSRTGNLDPNLISRQYKLDLMSKFMCIKFENPKMKQSEIAKQVGYSPSTLQRYRNDINMLSLYRIHPNNTNKQREKTSNTNSNNDLHRDLDIKRPQMTSNDLKRHQSTSNENKKK